MLVLARKLHEQILIGDGRIKVSVLEIHRGRVKLGITADPEIPILRAETAERNGACPQSARELELAG